MVAIEDMEMPKKCFECDFYLHGCRLKFTEECNPSIERAKDCPLVEIVTCKDCKHWDKEEEYCKKSTNEMGWSEDEYYRVYTDKDFYCADAKRRE